MALHTKAEPGLAYLCSGGSLAALHTVIQLRKDERWSDSSAALGAAIYCRQYLRPSEEI